MARQLAAALAFASGYAHQQYVAELPNGNNVPNINALGHVNSNGGGSVNPFGEDFGSAHSWTVDLCMADSDGDGQSNGLELGDPCCVWTVKSGHPPHVTHSLSHPGQAIWRTGRNCADYSCQPTPDGRDPCPAPEPSPTPDPDPDNSGSLPGDIITPVAAGCGAAAAVAAILFIAYRRRKATSLHDELADYSPMEEAFAVE